MKEMEQFDYGYPAYPPSILLVEDEAGHALKLKPKLECNGCQVHQIDPDSDGLANACQQYFELIVLNIEERDVDTYEVCRRLITEPASANIPLTIMTSCALSEKILKLLDLDYPVYY